MCTHNITCIIHTQKYSQVTISFALYLSLSEESLDKTLDYSHHDTTVPQGAKINDEADNGRAKVKPKYIIMYIAQ